MNAGSYRKGFRFGIAAFFANATLFTLPVFEKVRFQKWVRISFLANALVTPLIAFVYFYSDFSEKIHLLGIPCTITAPLAMLLFALMFKKSLEGAYFQITKKWRHFSLDNLRAVAIYANCMAVAGNRQ
ncbi:MAG: hypothetical protein JSW33_04960 [bacterium]|nr:MAG: hypothetical protein JSW33_04960 [bacterium]